MPAVADAVWPATLPPPRTASLRERLPDLTVRSRMSVGPDKVRRRASVGTRQFDVELDITATQVATLEAFYLTTLEGGALTFEWKDHRTGDAIDYRFLGPPQMYPRKPRKADHSEPWRASFSIEVIPAASDESSGGGDDPAAPNTFDTLMVSDGPAGGDGGGGDVQISPIPAESVAAPPTFLLDSMQVVLPGPESPPMMAGQQPVPVDANTNQHGPPGSTGSSGSAGGGVF
jgi:hypothetical protein